MLHVFLLTYNEQDLWCNMYPTEFVEQQFKTHNIHFVVLDNGNQPKMRQWCEQHGYTYYASEYNIGSAGGYNWMFKVANDMGVDNAVLIQADVEMNNAIPLLLTYKATEALGDTHFICWPQHLDNFWLSEDLHKAWDHNIHNLGNIVGFKPKVMADKDCYFDDNYVVTHFDDVEFIMYCRDTRKMKWVNLPYMICMNDQYYERCDGLLCDGLTIIPPHRAFVINSPMFQLKVHHASMLIDQATKGIADSHGPWYDYNKPYYDQVVANNGQRLPYDPSRWEAHGYLPYATQHEIDRFFNQFPFLKRESI